MSEQRYSRAFVRKACRGMRAMSDLQRVFAGALYVFAQAVRAPEFWWRRLWPW